MYEPGSPFYLDLEVANTGSALSDAQLFVALTVGTGDFWFYPSWVMFPLEIDWKNVFVPANALSQWVILPMFSWPYGAGSINDAMFFAAVIHDGELVSNLADYTFGWSDGPEPTPTPVPPTATPTPSGPTPLPPRAAYIPFGTFTQGSPSGEPCRYSNEGPQHQVTLTRGFHMMTTEVTRRMWAELKAVQPSLPADPTNLNFGLGMNHPVQSNTWYESVLFANLMSVQYGHTQCYYKDSGFTTPVNATNFTSGTFYCNWNANGYRLPTEAEWEYACRAGTTGAFSCSEPNYNSVNCNSCTSGVHPTLEQYCVYCANYPGVSAAVGSKLPNPWGLYDMHGNVWEWCWDWYVSSYPSGSVTDPTGASSGSFRVDRGGSWYDGAQTCRSAQRNSCFPFGRSSYLGFRLLRTAQ
jgi:formylglycine-generating enzyme required for sulfatase activity